MRKFYNFCCINRSVKNFCLFLKINDNLFTPWLKSSVLRRCLGYIPAVYLDHISSYKKRIKYESMFPHLHCLCYLKHQQVLIERTKVDLPLLNATVWPGYRMNLCTVSFCFRPPLPSGNQNVFRIWVAFNQLVPSFPRLFLFSILLFQILLSTRYRTVTVAVVRICWLNQPATTSSKAQIAVDIQELILTMQCTFLSFYDFLPSQHFHCFLASTSESGAAITDDFDEIHRFLERSRTCVRAVEPLAFG